MFQNVKQRKLPLAIMASMITDMASKDLGLAAASKPTAARVMRVKLREKEGQVRCGMYRLTCEL